MPDTPANLTVYHRGGGYQGGTGYPLVRVLALVACGTRTIIDATFGTDRIGETRYAHDLLGALRPGMIVLADRNCAAQDLLAAIAGTGADCWSGSRSDVTCRCAGDYPTTATSPGSAPWRSGSSPPRSPWSPTPGAAAGSTG